AVIRYGRAIELLLQHPEPGMPTLHEELFEKIKSLAPDNPILPKLSALLKGESAVGTSSASAPQSPQEFSWTGMAPNDAWKINSKAISPQDIHESIAEPEPTPTLSDPVPPAEPEPATLSTGFSLSNAKPDEHWMSLARTTDSADSIAPALSTHDQFHAYMKAGQQAEAQEWLSRLVMEQPDDAEARELFGSLLETKGDTAGAALQYSRALELLMADPLDKNLTRPTSLYAKVKELAPASPLLAEWASTFSPKPQAPVPAVETPVSARPVEEIDPETHYTLGVAYKNMGLLDEAKEEFCLSLQSQDFFSDSCLMIAVCLKEQGECRSASAQLELLLKDPKCQGAKAQAIRYELGLLYEAQEQWSQAAAIYESIPNFHDVPKRLESARAHEATVEPTSSFRYGN
ncbi:MAG TPA: tetratricopeptide repeat protein, partial [Nitrospiraceae bacterium]|nr:tetratricopeptide repeat protein [Nitrospiraceae bacterium]